MQLINRIFRRSGILLLLASAFTGACGDSGNDGFSKEGLDVEAVLELGLLSLAAYQQRIDCIDGEPFSVPESFELAEVFLVNEDLEKRSCRNDPGRVPVAFISTKDESIFLAFRGTADISEVIVDLMITQVPYPFVEDGGMTEQGFTFLYSQISDSIIEKINELIDTGNFSTLSVTGHSLGGALAVLAVPDIMVNASPVVTRMFNFAGPRVGDAQFAELYNSLIKTSRRVVNANDVVPQLPPIIPDLVEYEHVMRERQITFGTVPPPLPDFTDGIILSELLEVIGEFLKDFDDVNANHSMCDYYNTLCEETRDPDSCKTMAEGLNECNIAG